MAYRVAGNALLDREIEATRSSSAEQAWLQAGLQAEAEATSSRNNSRPPASSLRSEAPPKSPSPQPIPSSGPPPSPYGALAPSNAPPIKIETPLGTTAIFMSVMSRDTQFSSSQLSWMIGNHTYGMNFTRPENADDILVDAAFGLPIGAITKEIPDKITLLCSVAMPETAWRPEPGNGPIVLGPVAGRRGPAGDAWMVQVKFRRWILEFDESPEFTTVTLLFQGASDENFEMWPTWEHQVGARHLFT